MSFVVSSRYLSLVSNQWCRYDNYDTPATEQYQSPFNSASSVPPYVPTVIKPSAPYPTGIAPGSPSYIPTGGVPNGPPFVPSSSSSGEFDSTTYVLTLTTKVPCAPYVSGTETHSYTESYIITTATGYQYQTVTATGIPDVPQETGIPGVAQPESTTYTENQVPQETSPSAPSQPENKMPPTEVSPYPKNEVPTYGQSKNEVPQPTYTPSGPVYTGHKQPVPNYPGPETTSCAMETVTVPEYQYITISVPVTVTETITETAYGPTGTPYPSSVPEYPGHNQGCAPGSACYEGPNWNGTDVHQPMMPSGGSGTGDYHSTVPNPTGYIPSSSPIASATPYNATPVYDNQSYETY